jgi:sulfite reductase (ferredoxin)
VTSRPSVPTRSARPSSQWAVDGPTPRNHNKEIKALGSGLSFRKRIEQVYALRGFDSLPDDDPHGRFH